MSLSKLRKIHIIIIGSLVCAIAIAAMFFLLIKPKQEAYKAADERYQKAVVLGNEQSENKAIEERSTAIAKANQLQQLLQVQMNRRMPDLSFARRDLGMLALWREQIKTLGPLLESFAHDPSVTSVNARFNIPSPPLNPNDQIFDRDVLEYPLGSVQVAASSFKGILNNIRRWNNCRRLVMVGPPVLQGNSPQLMAAYNLTCYIFPVTKGGPAIPMAGQSGPGGQP